MKFKKYTLLLLACFSYAGIYAQRITLRSPQDKVSVDIVASDELTYSVKYGSKTVLFESPMGFEFTQAPPLGRNMMIVDSTRTSVQDKWTPVAGKHKDIYDFCNELHLQLKEKKYPQRRLDIIFRAYDDGVAFRYFISAQQGVSTYEITRELTGFHFARNHDAWTADYGAFKSSQESEFWPKKIGDISEKNFIGLPMLVKVDESCYAAITEANITDWPGFYFGCDPVRKGEGVVLNMKLASFPADNKVKVKFNGDHFSPWRVILLGSEPGKLIESEIVNNLNEPCVLSDISWIKPGKCAWDHWWSGEVKMDTETIKKFIRFASYMGFPYMLIDWQWYGAFNTPEADITKVNPAVDMPEVLRYAKEKNVRCWVWLYWTDAEKQYKDAFALYEKWGIAGVKIDFMDRDDQEMVNWYHKIVKSAAAHHLMVNFHGAFKPDGFSRTYPNLMTREGVMGNEYSKWSTRITPEHNVTLPFTRMLAGPMDYTPGGFLNRTPSTFKTGTPANVMNTRCQQLAMFVVYDSPIMTVCDDPDNYYDQPGIDFLKEVPVTWDDTRVLTGSVGEYICTARKSGDTWYIGAMNNSDAREIEIPLTFLGRNKYEAHIYADAQDADEDATKVSESKMNVTSKNKLKIKMAPGGGYVASIKSL